MKNIFFCGFATIALIITACNNDPKDKAKVHTETKNDTATAPNSADSKDIKTVAVLYTAVDAKASASINKISDSYLEIKNALANDKASEAASSAKAMEVDLGKLDKSLLTAEQKKLYDPIEESLQEHAAHIGKHGDNIKHQREHFAMMSEDVYDLVKAFGGGRQLYHDHCPMYKEKGAMWLSETSEIKNPYLGAEMPTCGTVEEVIK